MEYIVVSVMLFASSEIYLNENWSNEASCTLSEGME